MRRREWLGWAGALALQAGEAGSRAAEGEQRLLYVASPGIRNYTEFGGIGVLVYDVDRDYRWVKRIPTLPETPGQPTENVKGICACARTARLYVIRQHHPTAHVPGSAHRPHALEPHLRGWLRPDVHHPRRETDLFAVAGEFLLERSGWRYG